MTSTGTVTAPVSAPTIEEFKREFLEHLRDQRGVLLGYGSPNDCYQALAHTVRRRLVQAWIDTLGAQLVGRARFAGDAGAIGERVDECLSKLRDIHGAAHEDIGVHTRRDRHPQALQRRVRDLFLELRKAWNGVPFEVINDGEVTALAGSLALKKNAVLGIALGTSTAGGFVTAEGKITSWLNELAFVPVDYRENAPVDEWSGDPGVGARAARRVLAAAGVR